MDNIGRLKMKNIGIQLIVVVFVMNLFGYNKAATPPPDEVPESAPPNVIVIVADQMRRSAMSFWNTSEYQGMLNGVSDPVVTPTLDELANQGVVFNQAIANFPLCSPFRGMLMSGMYPNNNGVNNNTRNDRPMTGLKLDIDTLTEVFKESGYNTALFGKGHWHNNLPLFDEAGVYQGTTEAPGGHFLAITDYDTYIPPGEARQGIEYWYQSIGHVHNHPVVYSNDSDVTGGIKDGTPYYPKQYSAVNQADVLIDYIKNSRGQRDSTKPFSLLWTMDPPHNPYEDITDTDEEIFNQFYKTPTIQELLNRPNVGVDKAKKYYRIYFSMITLIDREIGRVMKVLEQEGIAENTLVVFTADHGEMMGSHSLMAKNTYYEESLGIPLIMSLPNKLQHRVDDLLINVPDFMPTILGLAGLKEQIPNNLDGSNFADYLLKVNDIGFSKPKSNLYYGRDSQLGVRTDKYTFAIDKNGELIALFDNKADPYQQTSLAFEDIPIKKRALLKSELGSWLKKIGHDYYKQRKYAQVISYPD